MFSSMYVCQFVLSFRPPLRLCLKSYTLAPFHSSSLLCIKQWLVLWHSLCKFFNLLFQLIINRKHFLFARLKFSDFNILFAPNVLNIKRKYIRNSQTAIYTKAKEQSIPWLFCQELFHFSNIVKAFYWINSIYLQTFRATYIAQKKEKVKLVGVNEQNTF